MIESILSIDELKEFINGDKMSFISFSANWCKTCKLIKPHYEKLATTYSGNNIKFARTDIDYIGVEKLEKINVDLNLGAIPCFYIYKRSELVDKLVTGQKEKLEEFIRLYIDGKTAIQPPISNSSYTYNRIVRDASPVESKKKIDKSQKENNNKISNINNNNVRKQSGLTVPLSEKTRSLSTSPQSSRESRISSLTVPVQGKSRSPSNSSRKNSKGKNDWNFKIFKELSSIFICKLILVCLF